MSSGCPVVLSDAVPGRFELVRQGDTGFIYPCGNVDALASIFREVLENPERLKGLSSSAAERMKAWSLGAYADGLALALARIVPVRAGLTREQEA
jgi:glycosyltransferase involved in cell wall biosynthesis